MDNPNWDRFESTLTEQLARLFASDPAYQRVKATHTPAQLAAKTTLGLADGSASKDGEGVQATCKALALKSTYKAIRAYLTNEPKVPAPKMVTVAGTQGETHRVECFATFDHEIDGETFRFHVTREVDGLNKVVTHAKSGLRACLVGVDAAYLPAYAKLSDDKSRAKASLAALIDRIGAPRVRSEIASAKNLD